MAHLTLTFKVGIGKEIIRAIIINTPFFPSRADQSVDADKYPSHNQNAQIEGATMQHSDNQHDDPSEEYDFRRPGCHFAVPFFVDGRLQHIGFYSTIDSAREDFAKYVSLSDLERAIRKCKPDIDDGRLSVEAYGAVEHTPFAGTRVYEVFLDERLPDKPKWL